MSRPPREKLWVVRAGDGVTVGAIVTRAGEDPSRALAEGRVFVGKRRVTDPKLAVKVGDAVRIGAAAAAPSSPSKVVRRVEGGVAFAVKEAGLPTVPDHAGAAHSLVALVARELGLAPEALVVTSRLDREVSGVVLFATTEAAAERLRAARAAGAYDRRYLALAACAAPMPESGAWEGAIGNGKDPRHRQVDGVDAKASRTRFRVVARLPHPERAGGEIALLAVAPETGRTHQIRVHASHAGAPLLGDRDYGGPMRLGAASGAVLALGRIALHAARVVVPGETGELRAEADVPPELRDAWRKLGGDDEAWARALDVEV